MVEKFKVIGEFELLLIFMKPEEVPELQPKKFKTNFVKSSRRFPRIVMAFETLKKSTT